MTQVWLITGCSSGLGLELARTVLKQGHIAVATSRDPQKNTELVKEITSHPNGTWLALDVCDSATQVSQVVSQAIHKHGRIDVLVNNAGNTHDHASYDANHISTLTLFT